MMNERIRELAEKANIKFGRMAILDGDPRGMARLVTYSNLEKFTELIIEEAAKAPLCDSDGVVGKYSDSDRYYFETLMKKQLGLK
jgi:hypothetical protein